MDCDIVGFQKFFSKKELEKLCKELGFDYFITVDNAKTDKKITIFISTTVALASKFPILKIKKHNFQGHFSFSRTPIKALIGLPNNLQITVYVNHFKSNRLNEFEYIFGNYIQVYTKYLTL